ncbi:Fic family protein [Candidatus Saganbacteria bacterium]|nr:Fic family protein [Candidatus Saganbacteria bacterium]
MNENIERLLDKLTAYKKKLDALRPISKSHLEKLKEYFDVEWTYNSNAIEGNSLSLGETKLVILEGITIGGKTVREHLEALNHKKAIDFLESIVKKADKINEETVKKLHWLILREIDDENAGKYRGKQVYISGSHHLPPHPQDVPFKMKEFIRKLNNDKGHPAIKAADAHYGFVAIHPFIDGNGRTARLLMNLIFIHKGYPPVIIPMSRREEYIYALEKAHSSKKLNDFYTLICECAEQSLVKYINAFK